MSFQSEKQLVRRYHQVLAEAPVADLAAQIAPLVHTNWNWMGFHPWGDLTGPQAVVEQFWAPLTGAVTSMQRREDIFFAGRNELDGLDGVWVVSMGHLMGLFDAPWLGIRPTGKLVFLRYCEFHHVKDGQITQTAFYCDVPHLMMQAGQNPFPPQTGAHCIQPGPLTHHGLLYEDAPPEEGAATLGVINRMIGDLGQWNSGLSLEDELALTWAEDMLWWGPAGIGSTYTISRYAKQHSGPFRAAFADRSKTQHIARLAEGHYGGFFGRPNFSGRHKGGFMGLPGNDRICDFRVIDIYRREGEKLAENWVFIDILHWLYQQGDDVLGRISTL